MKKRGFLSLKGLIMAIVFAIVILAFIQAGKSFGNRDVYFKDAAAKDIALIIDSLYSNPGDAAIKYEEDLSKYTVWIKDNTVTVYKTSDGKTDITQGKYGFVGQSIDETIVRNPTNLIIKKTNNKIIILNQQDFKGFGGGSEFSGGGVLGVY